MKITQTVYTLEPTKEFEEIQIIESEHGFSYHVSINREFGNSHYVVFKNCIIGAFGYLKERQNFDKNIVKTFNSIDECFESIKNLTKEKIDKLFEDQIRIGQPLFASLTE